MDFKAHVPYLEKNDEYVTCYHFFQAHKDGSKKGGLSCEHTERQTAASVSAAD